MHSVWWTRPSIRAWCDKFVHVRESVAEEERPLRSQRRFFALGTQKLVDRWDKWLLVFYSTAF